MYIRTAYIDFDDANLIFFVDAFAAVSVFVNGETADVGNDRFMEALAHFGQFFGNNFVNAGVLEPYGIDEPRGAFRNTGCRVAETGFSGSPFEREGTQNVDIIQFRKFVAIAESTAGGNHGVIQRNTAECYFCVYHLISSFSSTGPSLQIRLLPYFVSQLHPMHAPKPQPMRSSKLSWPLVSVTSERAFSMGSGPQV